MGMKNILKIMCMFVVMLVSFIPVSFALSLNSNNPTLIITFDKLQDVNVVVKKRITNAMDSPVDFEPEDQAIITLTKIPTEPGEQELIQFLDYSVGSGPKTVQLVPGEYIINGQYISNKEVVIPGRKDTYCKGYGGGDPKQTASDFTTTAGGVVAGAAVASVISSTISGGLAAAFTVTTAAATSAVAATATTAAVVAVPATTASLASFAGIAAALGPVGLVVLAAVAVVAITSLFVDCIGEEISVPIPEFSMNPAILGGVQGNITITKNIYSGNDLTFYVFAIEDPLLIEDLNIVGMLEELGITYPEYIRPS